MPTPEQQREYTRLSGLLNALCTRHRKEFPSNTCSLALTNSDDKILVETYDNKGKLIATLPQANTSVQFYADMEKYFKGVTLPDENVVAFLG